MIIKGENLIRSGYVKDSWTPAKFGMLNQEELGAEDLKLLGLEKMRKAIRSASQNCDQGYQKTFQEKMGQIVKIFETFKIFNSTFNIVVVVLVSHQF